MSFRRILAWLLCWVELMIFGVPSGPKAQPPQIPQTPIVRDVTADSRLSPSVLYASQMQNTVQAVYTDSARSAYEMQNTQMRLVHRLRGLRKTATLTDPDGNVYVQNSFDAFYTDSRGQFHSRYSMGEARINTVRLGLYYDECHVRDMTFSRNDFALDKAYHIYGDRLYQQFTLYALHATEDLCEFGSVVRIPCARVQTLEIRDRSGIHKDPAAFDPDSVEYAALDIRGTGVVGFIVPPGGGRLTVEKKAGQYILRQYAPYTSGTGINKYDETGTYALNCVTFGCRIFTDSTHNFDGVAEASRQERNPLTVQCTGDGRFLRYDPLRGSYDVQTDFLSFQQAFADPDHQIRTRLTVAGDEQSRDIYIRGTEPSGQLEGAAVLDDTGAPAAIPVQVSKNFHGDYGEDPLYYTAMDVSYGDSFTPLRIPAKEQLQYTLVHVFQNWGKAPLKQLSSIEFHVSYYHLSTGVTESNCIAPYGVYGKDSWMLPDFRGRSGTMWAEQPQFNSVGVLKFMQYRKGRQTIRSEYRGSRIDSVGQTYADITTAYESDCGSYTYSLRHSEMPQTDENRTYYTLDVQFTHEITFANFRRDFDLFYFDGRDVTYTRFGYLSAQNEPTVSDVQGGIHYCTLGSNAPYFDFFSVTPETESRIDERFGSSFGLIVRQCRIMQNGREASIPLALRQNNDSGRTSGVLTLDAERLTFRPGDSITLDMILLPWGTGRETADDNVRAVREDSALHAPQLSVQTGTILPDSFLPTVRCAGNEAVFTLQGGRNNTTVRIDGFTGNERPRVLRQDAGAQSAVTLSSANGYDGMTVHYNPDGTYGFSFVLPAQPDSPQTYIVTQK